MTLKLQPYLIFENSLEALTYYEQLFDAKLIFRQSASPAVAAHLGISDRKPENITLHALMLLAGHEISFADNFTFQKTENAAFLLTAHLENPDEVAELENLWTKASSDSSVTVLSAYETQAFGGKEGFISDKYGIRWHFVAEPDFSKIKPD